MLPNVLKQLQLPEGQRKRRPRFVLHIICIIISLPCSCCSSLCPRVPLSSGVFCYRTCYTFPCAFCVFANRNWNCSWNWNWNWPGAFDFMALIKRASRRSSLLRVFRVGKFIQFSIWILLVFPRRVSRSLVLFLNCSVSCLAFHYLLLHLRTPSKWVHLSYRIGIIFNALPLFCCLYKFVGYNEVKAWGA